MERNETNYEIGSRIREMREYSNYTREHLAEKANISVQFLADIETGRKSMTVKTLKNISLALNISSDYILFGSSNPSCPHVESSNLSLLMSNLTHEEQQYAEELIKIYIKAIVHSKH